MKQYRRSMGQPRSVWLMWLVSVSIAALAAIFEALTIAAPGGAARAGLDVYTVVFFILAPVYATVGAVIVWRAAGNRVGWVIASIGLLLAIENFAGSLVSYALTPAGRWLPGTIWIDWLSNWIWVPAVVGALALLPIFFPDGRVPSKRWRTLVWLVCAAAAISAIGFVLSPDPITVSSSTATFVNPTGIAALGPASSLFHALYVIAILMGVLGGAASLVVRYRRGNPDERHQVKWFAGAFVSVAALLAAYAGGQYLLKVVFPDWVIGVILCLALSAVPLAVAVAVLKYRLYDIDVVLSRALVYALLAGFITAVYVAIVVGVGTLIGSGNKPNLGLSILATAVVAVGFQPVRERVQKLANRLVYGVRATPYEVLAQFSEHVAETYAGDEVLSRMARVLAEGTGAGRAEVWLRSGAYMTAAATYPENETADEPVPVQGQLMPEIRGADHAVPVLHQGELLGALAVTKRQGESLTPIEEKLLGDLALQAGLVLKNVGLTSDLLQRLDELRLSRQRLVAAQDAERRRLERDLHDGAQQNLVALKVKLNLAEMYAGKDPAKARALMGELTADADEALETLRDLARGIYPPLLADRGLAAALQSQGRKAPMPVEVDADGIGRYPQDAEAAVYFCCLEALQNVAKYADGATAHVRVSHDGGSLVFSVTDNGRGFDSETTAKGSGLQNMSDRLAALGGELAVWSSPAGGTRISGTLHATRLN